MLIWGYEGDYALIVEIFLSTDFLVQDFVGILW